MHPGLNQQAGTYLLIVSSQWLSPPDALHGVEPWLLPSGVANAELPPLPMSALHPLMAPASVHTLGGAAPGMTAAVYVLLGSPHLQKLLFLLTLLHHFRQQTAWGNNGDVCQAADTQADGGKLQSGGPATARGAPGPAPGAIHPIGCLQAAAKCTRWAKRVGGSWSCSPAY